MQKLWQCMGCFNPANAATQMESKRNSSVYLELTDEEQNAISKGLINDSMVNESTDNFNTNSKYSLY
jgi:hypothetical protein